jgi:hypothetical protein
MYALIVKSNNVYELQIKKEIESSDVSHRERCASADILKKSITAEWEGYSGKNKDIVWVARIV